ncbi:MAG: hypothetical protein IJ530_01675 [Treponema sp.]|uniref:hypothetical protein n=1 Tax=Treponema sp. TaxID=166 RepID=UPI0025E823C1|nr:hypothetical protein [Treponema sp.]MBQ8678450.1 hypothetical protein [Treponema sp.]
MELDRIIALYGSLDVGKTTTLNILIDLFIKVASKYSVEVVWENGFDRRAAIFFKNKTICICTPGDNAEIIRENISFFSKNKCNIAILATRTKGQSKDTLNEYAKTKHLEVEGIKKNDDLTSCGEYAANIFCKIISDLKHKKEV